MERRHLTLMFTDIVGYSRLMGQNETQCIALLGDYRRILLAQIEQHEGTVIEFIGDAVFARFETPLAAVQAGIAIQRQLQQYNLDADPGLPKLQSRIGIHAGEVTLQNDALFGDDVNIAARLEPIAVADALCISDAVYQAVKSHIDVPILSLGTQPLKNIESKKIRAYLVRPAGITLATHAHYWLKKTQQKIERYRYPLSACVLAIILAAVYFVPRILVPGYSANYVEIADFKNLMSENAQADYFSAGITEALRSQLADIRNIYILDANQGVRGPIRLEGSVQKFGDHIRIAYRLIRRKDNVQIAGGKLDGAYRDIFILQDRVVAEVAGYLADEFNTRMFRPAAPRLTSDITAYDYYMQGLESLKKPQSHENADEAINLFTTALVHDPKFAQANAGLCRAYRAKYLITKTADWATRAAEYCQLALTQNDNLSEVYESLGMIYTDIGKEKQAVDILQTALTIDSQRADTKIALAKIYGKQNQDDKAARLFNEVIEENSHLWVAHYELGNFYMSKGQIELAIHAYLRALSITPENEFALSNLGVAYNFIGEYGKAADALAKAVEISPSSWAYSNTGTMYYFAGKFDKAVQMFQQAVKMSPNDFRWYLNLADAQRQVNKTQQHTEQLKADNVQATLVDGPAVKNYKTAIDLAVESLKLNPNDAQIYQYLATAYLFVGQTDTSKEMLEKALALSPNDVNVLYANARLANFYNDTEQSLSALRKLIASGFPVSMIEVDPDFKGLVEQQKFQELLLSLQ